MVRRFRAVEGWCTFRVPGDDEQETELGAHVIRIPDTEPAQIEFLELPTLRELFNSYPQLTLVDVRISITEPYG